MTKAQIKNYNRMLSTLRTIASYQTPEQLQKGSEADWGLSYHEALEMAYENVLEEARRGALRIRFIKGD